MSPEAQHEAISRACGYYLISDDETASVSLRHPTETTRYPWRRKGHEQFAWEDGPDWLGDLNAMHEAEKVLTSEQMDDYAQRVYSIVARDGVRMTCGISAPAAQRAEAFLRCLGKWTD